MCNLFCLVQHRGEILERAIKESGFSISKLAKRLNKSRQYMYNLFLKSDVNPDIIIQIGKIIGHDFTSEIQFFQQLEEPKEEYSKENAKYWKEKYIELLEKYNALLESKDKS